MSALDTFEPMDPASFAHARSSIAIGLLSIYANGRRDEFERLSDEMRLVDFLQVRQEVLLEIRRTVNKARDDLGLRPRAYPDDTLCGHRPMVRQ